jgi:hypothetical protein
MITQILKENSKQINQQARYFKIFHARSLIQLCFLLVISTFYYMNQTFKPHKAVPVVTKGLKRAKTVVGCTGRPELWGL